MEIDPTACESSQNRGVLAQGACSVVVVSDAGRFLDRLLSAQYLTDVRSSLSCLHLER